MKQLKTFEIIEHLTQAIKTQDQRLINMYAYELATRLYVPNSEHTFEELMEGFGYRTIEKVNPNQITIEEYMRTRKQEERPSC